MSGVNILFAHDTEEALASAVALINTDSDDDTLTTIEELDEFVTEWGITGSHTHDEAELEAVRAVRSELRRIWTCGDDLEFVNSVNRLLSDAEAIPQLVRHDNWDWHLHATSPEQPLATRIAVEVAMAFVDVVRTGQRERLATCAADDCDDVLIDLSRNRSRRYCEGRCGNRVHVAAYRARQAAASTDDGPLPPSPHT